MQKLNFLQLMRMSIIFRECLFFSKRVKRLSLLIVASIAFNFFGYGFINTKNFDFTDVILTQRQISGKVTDSNGQPIPGVNILEKGTSNGVVSDFDGNFSLNVTSSNTILVFSYIGFQKKEVVVGESSNISVSLEEDVESLDEVVVVGYGTVKKRDLTSAISSIDGEDIIQRIDPRLDGALQGQMAGVNVQQSSGVPGAAPVIRIRGIGSISSGNSPLYVVDGLPIEDNSLIGNLNMNDVKSVEVLKDAASASIYGSRGANGVVIITTKKGRKGKPMFNFNSYYGFQAPEKRVDYLSANEMGEYLTEVINYFWVSRNGGDINDPNSVRPINRRVYPEWTSGNLTDYQAQDYIFDDAAPVQNQTISVSGGDEKSQYFGSLDYMDQDGVFRGTGFERYSARLNLDSQLNSKLKIGFNLNPSYSIQTDRNTEGKDAAINRILWNSPLLDKELYYFDPELGFAVHPVSQELRGASLDGNYFLQFERVKETIRRAQVLASAYLDFQIIEGLNYRANLGLTYSSLDADKFIGFEEGNGQIESYQDNNWRTNWLVENTLNYVKNFGKHELSALAGYSVQKDRFNSTNFRGRGQPNDLVTTLGAASVIDDWNERLGEWSLISYLGRLTYGFDNKYLLTASVRRDGSSRFGPNTKWGVFPSASAAWRVSEESFMQNLSFLSNLKLRASWGKTGNNQIGNYSHISLVSSNFQVPFGSDGGLTAGIRPITLGDEDLSWEKTTAINFGIDIGLIKNRINLSVDAYKNETEDLLLNVPIPSVTGFSSQLRNYGQVENKGLEFELNSANLTGEFKWNTSLNIAFNKNEVTQVGPDGNPIVAGPWYAEASYVGVGEPIGSFYLYVQDGIIDNQAELDAAPRFGSEDIGAVKLVDTNGDGVVTPDDRQVVGQPFPKYNWGITNTFSYKNFDLSVFLNGAGGHKTYRVAGRYDNVRRVDMRFAMLGNWRDRWRSEDNPGDGITPSINSNSNTNNLTTSTRWLQDSDWWRVKNITLGYTLPKTISERIGLDNLRMFVTGDNLFLNTDYVGFNPEGVGNPDGTSGGGEIVSSGAGYDYGTYPLAKRFVFGINVSF